MRTIVRIVLLHLSPLPLPSCSRVHPFPSSILKKQTDDLLLVVGTKGSEQGMFVVYLESLSNPVVTIDH